MKYLIPLLLFTVSVFAQTTIKPLTQENIEAAITDDPAFRTSIGAASAAQGTLAGTALQPSSILTGGGTITPKSSGNLDFNSLGGATGTFHVADYGALGDTRIVTDAIMTAASATLDSTAANFVDGPAASGGDVGKFIEVQGAGTSGVTLHTTIQSVIDENTVVLANAAGTTTVASRALTNVTTTLGSSTLTCAGGAFTNADLGKKLIVGNAYPVETRITAINSGTSVEMARPAGATSGVQTTTVPGATAAFGTDDTDAIQDALEAAKAAGGGTVVLGVGTYFVGTTSLPVATDPINNNTHGHGIKVHSNTILQGAGIGATVIRGMSNYSNCPVIFGSASLHPVTTRMQNVTIRDLTVDGNKYLKTPYTGTGVSATSGEDEGINFYGIDKLRIYNVEIKDCLADGIDLDGVGDDCDDIVFDVLRIIGNNANGMHLEADNLRVSNCHFENNCADYWRSNLSVYPDQGAFETRQGDRKALTGCTFLHNDVDISASSVFVSNCIFQNGIGIASINHELNGSITFDGCGWNIYGGCATAIRIDTPTSPTPTSTIEIRNCAIAAAVGIDMVSGRNLVVTGCSIASSGHSIRILNLNGGNAWLSNNRLACNGSASALRVEAATPVYMTNNSVSSGANYAISIHDGSHIVQGNTSTGTQFLRLFAGSACIVRENDAAGHVIVYTQSNKITRNKFNELIFSGGSAINNTFIENEVMGTVTLGSVTYASNTWRGNYGAGITGVFNGTATLTSGTATVSTAAANSARKWSLTRQAPNASTAIGDLSIGTVTAQTSFVINALTSTATVATGDLSTVYWEIIE